MVKNSILIILILLICSIIVGYIVKVEDRKNKDSSIEQKQEINFTNEPVMISHREIQEEITDYYNIDTSLSVQTSNNSIDLNILLKNKKLSVKELSEKENLILSFLKNNNISRNEKINTLWNIFNNLNNLEAQKFIIDYLSIMKPVELTTNIIKKYEECENISLKVRLISLLNNSLYIANENLDEDKLQFIAKKTKEIESFFKEQLLDIENIDSNLAQHLIELVPNILSTNDSYKIIDKLAQNTNLSKTKEYTLKVDIAFSTNDSELEFAPKLLNELKTLTKKESKIVNSNLYSLIELGSINEYIIPDLIDYIDSQKPSLYDEEIYIDYLEWTAYNYKWLKARASIDNMEKEDYIIKALFSSDNSIYQANIIVYTDDIILNKIEPDKKIIIQNIQNSLGDDTISTDEQRLLETALQILEEEKNDQINDLKDENLPPISTDEFPHN